jgi:hypothetical protein
MEESDFFEVKESNVPYIEGCKQRSKVMNPNSRIHKDRVVGRHRSLQDDKKQSLTFNQSCSEMKTSELAAYGVGEISNFSSGKPSTEKYILELLRRATVRGEIDARECIKQCFRGLVLSWLRSHPKRRAACELDREENYIALTFEHFWQATALTQHIEFNSLTGALDYLHACLNGVVIEKLRVNSRSIEIPLQEPGQPGELQSEDNFESKDVWENLKRVMPNGNEQRLAYLIFHCGLKPRQIMQFYPQEFSDIHDIYRIRSNMMNRLVQKQIFYTHD